MSYMYDDWWNDLSIETKQNILKNTNIINPDEICGILNFLAYKLFPLSLSIYLQ